MNAKWTVLLALWTTAALANPPAPQLTYSGYLLDATGAPVTAQSTLTFRLYDVADFGTPLYSEDVVVTPDATGWFSARIGVPTPLQPSLFDRPLWLGIKESTDLAEMVPRVPLTSSPYALSADWTGLTAVPAGFADGTDDGLLTVSHDATMVGDGATNALGVDFTRVQARISTACPTGSYLTGVDAQGAPGCAAAVGAVSVTAPLTVSGTTTRTLAIPQASGTTNGYLSSTDWTAFNTKEAALAFTSPLARSVNTISIPAASGTANGYLTSANWTTFNNKEPALSVTAPLSKVSGTLSMPAANGTTNGYLTSANWTTFNNKENALTFSAPLARSVNAVSIPAASGTANGYLTSANWTTFNNKENALSFSAPLTRSTNTIGMTQASSSASGFLSSADWVTFNSKAPGSGSASYIHNQVAAVQAAGFNIGGDGTIGSLNVTGARLAPLVVNGTHITKAQFGSGRAVFIAAGAAFGLNSYWESGWKYSVDGGAVQLGLSGVSDGLSVSVSPAGVAGGDALSVRRFKMHVTTQGVWIGDNADATGPGIANEKLTVAGDIRVGTAVNNGCVKDFDGTALVGTCSSDARLKQDITPLAPVLDRIVQLTPVTYGWRAEEFPERHFGTGESFGLVAQEVEQLFPDMVVTDADGYRAVKYHKLPLLLLKAVQEEDAERAALAERVRELEQERSEQQRRIEELEKKLQKLAERLER